MRPTSTYYWHFARSTEHAILAVATLGLGVAWASPLSLLVGGVGYVLGWLFLPGLPFHRDKVDRRLNAAQAKLEAARLEQQRTALEKELSKASRAAWQRLRSDSMALEAAVAALPQGGDGPTIGPKLDTLLWHYLQLLAAADRLALHLDHERSENLEAQLAAAEEAAAKELPPEASEAAQRLAQSRRETAETLRRRVQRAQQGQETYDLILAEQERLVQQVKLLRAEAATASDPTRFNVQVDNALAQLAGTTRSLELLGQTTPEIGWSNLGEAPRFSAGVRLGDKAPRSAVAMGN